MSSDAERIITDELGRYLGENLHGKARVMIPCPFHKEIHPSLQINLKDYNNRPAGFYYCFGCKASSNNKGGWNALAKLLGLKQVDGDGFVRRTFSKRLVKPKAPETLEEMLNFWQVQIAIPFPINMEWRGFSGKLLNSTGCLLGTSEKFGRKGAIFPVYCGSDIVGAVFAAFDTSDKAIPKYINSPGRWSRTDGLFMMHYASKLLEKIKRKTLIITEGPRDSLRLLKYGIPAVSVLGANNWSDEKTTMLLEQDISRVIIGLDSDDAGRSAERSLRKALAGKVTVERLHYPSWEKGKDPNDVSVRCLKYWIHKHKLERYDTSKPLKRADFSFYVTK